LVAEILLQRTRAMSVARIWPDLVSRYPDPQSLANATATELEDLLGSLGLLWRIPLLIQLAKHVAEHGGIPKDKSELMKLPGVGEYVASAYLSLHRNKRHSIVDSNVVRWICRLTGNEECGAETRRAKWMLNLAESLTPRTTFKDYNYAVLDLTMNVCKKTPSCTHCPVSGFCASSLADS